MSIVTSQSTGFVKGLPESDALCQLDERVSQALEQKKAQIGGLGGQMADSREMVNYIADISRQPVPGMTHSFVV